MLKLTKNKKIILSVIYIVLVVSLFMVYRFPADEIRQYMLSKLNRPGSALTVSIARVTPAFPPGVILKKVDIFYQDISLLKAERVRLTPKLWSLFGPEADFTVAGKAGGGTLTGRVALAKGSLKQLTRFRTQLAGIQLGHSAALKKLLNIEASGMVAGDIAFEGNSTLPEKLTAQLTVSDFKINIPAGILEAGKLEFKSIKTDLSAAKQQVKIKKCAFKGDQMSGSISGSIILKSPASQSKIDLKGSVQAHFRLLKDLGSDLNVGIFNKNRLKGDRFPVRIGGTIGRPAFF